MGCRIQRNRSGYFLGHAWKTVEAWSTGVGVFLAAMLLLVLRGNWLKRFDRRE